jgi:glyoxylase-like metal-dependent hydrolase (beta-lactamase superfamily II)
MMFCVPTRSLTVGPFEVIAVQVQPQSLQAPERFFPDADPLALEAVRAHVPGAFGESANELRFSQSLCVLRAGDDVTVVDAGLPPSKDSWPLMQALHHHGIKPESVTRVFITHRDTDHIGGLADRRKRDGGITFTNARHFISTVELEAFRNDEPRRELFEQVIAPLERAGLLEVIEAPALERLNSAPEFAPGLRAALTPGHRIGATSVLADDALLLTADVLHAPFQVTHPEVSITFDADKAQAAQTRAAVVELAQGRGWLLHVPHTPPFGIGRAVKGTDGKAYWQEV